MSLPARVRATTSLTQYDPRTSVKQIAFLEMAEKHWAKAKDATQLEQAIRAKLEAQAEFVFWLVMLVAISRGATKGMRYVAACLRNWKEEGQV